MTVAQTLSLWPSEHSPLNGNRYNTKSTHINPSRFSPFGKDGFTFSDLIDVINPLHHFPIIGPAYRKITGDNISSLPKITGSTLFLGPIGGGLALADTVLEVATGKDTETHFLAMFDDPSRVTPKKSGLVNRNEKNIRQTSVRAWAMTELSYQKQKFSSQNAVKSSETVFKGREPNLPSNVSDANSVVEWAKAENAYRSGLATRSYADANKNIVLPSNNYTPAKTKDNNKLQVKRTMAEPHRVPLMLLAEMLAERE